MVFPLYLYTKGSSAGKRLLILWSTWFDFVFKKLALVQNRHFTELYLELRKSLSIKKDHRYHGIILSARLM